jgi:proteasome lid subunit RPN8/RPN11
MNAPESAIADTPAEWDSDLLKALYELVFSSPGTEVAGVLVGNSLANGRSRLPMVRAAIPAAEGFLPGQAAVFTHQTWSQVHAAMARHYEGLEPVGWYISRPGHGTELMQPDVANHHRWFTRPDQILLAVDSRSHRAAIYGWAGETLQLISEGPIARRYTRPPRPRFPSAAIALLVLIGVIGGALAFLLTQLTGG